MTNRELSKAMRESAADYRLSEKHGNTPPYDFSGPRLCLLLEGVARLLELTPERADT